MTRTKALPSKGKRAYGSKPQRRENLTVIGAIALKGFLGAMTVNAGTDRDVFRAFIEQILVPSIWEGATVVMDNLPAHKLKLIQETITAAAVKVIYLPAYSPDFNPIENCWSKLKEYLRSVAARTRATLAQALVPAIDLVTLKDIRNWFTHCCCCTSFD